MVTFAPTSSNFFLIASASSLGTPSLIGLGALSTRSLASFRPRLVTSRTTLITLILLPPTSVSETVNSVFSSAGAAAPPPAIGIPIGTAAAADTPSSDSSVFTSWLSSRTLMPLMYSTTCACVTSAMLISLFSTFDVRRSFLVVGSRFSAFGALLLRRRQHVHEVARRRAQHRDDLHHGRLQHIEQLGEQLGAARQRRELGHLGRLDRAARDDGRLDRQRGRRLDERRDRLGEDDRVVRRVRHGRRPHEVGVERLEGRALDRAPGQRVLDDL